MPLARFAGQRRVTADPDAYRRTGYVAGKDVVIELLKTYASAQTPFRDQRIVAGSGSPLAANDSFVAFSAAVGHLSQGAFPALALRPLR